MRIDQSRWGSANRRGSSNYRLRLPRLKYAPECGGCSVERQRQTRRNARVRCVFGCVHTPVYLFRRDLLRRAAPSCTTTLECNSDCSLLPPSLSFSFSLLFFKPFARTYVPFCSKYPRIYCNGDLPRRVPIERGMFKWASAICYETRAPVAFCIFAHEFAARRSRLYN